MTDTNKISVVGIGIMLYLLYMVATQDDWQFYAFLWFIAAFLTGTIGVLGFREAQNEWNKTVKQFS